MFRAFRTVLAKALENRLWETLPGYHEKDGKKGEVMLGHPYFKHDIA